MAPNIIGSTFILAETAISNKDDIGNSNNKNSQSNCTTIITTKTICTNINTNIIEKSAKMTTTTTTAAATTTTYPAIIPSNAINDQSLSSNQNNPLHDLDTQIESSRLKTQSDPTRTQIPKPYKLEIVWRNVVLFVILHSMALYGVWLVFAENAYLEVPLAYFGCFIGGMGITAGVHRLWSHRAYKARLPLRIFLMLCQSLAFQNSIYEWSRDHRVHHKFTDTNADPHNSQRGFFFSHMGWLMCKKHPDVKEQGRKIDMSDLEADPVVMFQKKYYFFIMPICCFVLPTLFHYYCMGSSLRVCFFVCSILRYTITLHGTWLVNSAAHFYGMKPYDTRISAVDTRLVSRIAFGEGWHNYHHVFPWDYKAAELGTYRYNWTTAFINLMAKIGQAYDLKSVSKEMVLKRVQRTGDGSHSSVLDHNNNNNNNNSNNNNNNNTEITDELIAQLDHENEKTLVWGWDDKDVSEFDRNSAQIVDKKDV